MDLKIQNTVEEPNVLDELACSGSPQDLGRRKELLSQFWQQVYAKGEFNKAKSKKEYNKIRR